MLQLANHSNIALNKEKLLLLHPTGKNVKFPCPGNVQYRAEFPVF